MSASRRHFAPPSSVGQLEVVVVAASLLQIVGSGRSPNTKHQCMCCGTRSGDALSAGLRRGGGGGGLVRWCWGTGVTNLARGASDKPLVKIP